MMSLEKEIYEFLENLNLVYSSKDSNQLEKIIWKDESYFSFGNGKDMISYDFNDIKTIAERDFRDIDSLSLDLKLLSCEGEHNICWFGADGYMNVKVGSELFKEYIRLTGVLVKNESILKARQLHISFPQGGYELGKNWFTKKGLSAQIEIWLETFNLERNFIDQVQKEKFVQYLSNAKKILDGKYEILEK